MDFKKLPQTELEVMNVIWGNEETLSTNEVADIITLQKGWKAGTTSTLLKRLIKKDFLSAEKRGKQFYYFPKVEEKEYKSLETKEFLKNIHGNSLTSLVSMLHDTKDLLSDEDLEKLDRMIKNRY